MNWEKFFDPMILERGKEYFQRHQVSNLVITSKKIAATVLGSHQYDVEIRLNPAGNIKDFSCTCPHFDLGNNCKHIAAVLYAYAQSTPEVPKPQASPEDLLSLPYIRKEFTKIKSQYSDHRNFIDYINTPDFAAAIRQLIQQVANQALSVKEILTGFKNVNYIITRFVKTPMDDDGDVIDICTFVEDVWSDFCRSATLSDRKKIYQWFAKNILEPDDELWALQDHIMNFLDQHFLEDDAIIEDKLRLIDEKTFQIMSQNYNELGSDLHLAWWVNAKIRCLEALNVPSTVIQNVYSAHWDNVFVRHDYIDYLINHQEYAKALSSARKSLRLNSTLNKIMVAKDYEKLYHIYQYLNDLDRQIECLIWLVAHGETDPYYQDLKTSMSSQNWHERRLEIINSIPDQYTRAEYFSKEKMIPELYNLIIKTEDPEFFYRYANRLSKNHAPEIVEQYAKFLDTEARLTLGRKYYRSLVAKLRRLAKLPLGNERAKRLVLSWQNQYSHRRAMMEELAKLHFSES